MMKPTHIKVTTPAGKVLEGVIDKIENLMVTINHCYTAPQTAQAMADGRNIREGKTVKRNGWTIEPYVKEAANDATQPNSQPKSA